jgi:hypothetical protein
MVVVPCSFRHIGCMYQDKRCKMPKHYNDANAQHLMLLSTRFVALETKHRIDLNLCEKKFEHNLEQISNQFNEAECKCAQIEAALDANRCAVVQMEATLNRLTAIAHVQTDTPPTKNISPLQINEWPIDMSSKRKTHFSPSYALQNTSYTIHMWFKPEIEIDVDSYATVCLILERCDTEDELPVSFNCCFVLGDDKAYLTTDLFNLSGHVSKPMVLCKASELVTHVDDNNQVVLKFSINARHGNDMP